MAVAVAPVSGYADQPFAPTPTTLNGEDGVWFEETEAERLLYEVGRISDLELSIDISKGLVKSYKSQVQTATTTSHDALEIAVMHKDRGDFYHKAYLEELDRSDSLWNSTLFWGIAGLVLGSGIAGGSAWLATR